MEKEIPKDITPAIRRTSTFSIFSEVILLILDSNIILLPFINTLSKVYKSFDLIKLTN